MNLGVQYYRAPFPEQKYWEDDFKRIKDSGLNTVQLWILWAWVEARPGTFVFDDYDRLMDLAAKNGLGVILSMIAEIQPYWIHREVPDSEMIDHLGHKVVSSNRGECHFGLTPGGCTDHPDVWTYMSRFLTRTVERYGSHAALRGWDAWNELRWNVNADGRVCHCQHTLAAFRAWLDSRYDGLDGLNRAWKRRYGQWDEVLPGKMPHRPYTEMMAWEHFITWRANQHGRLRYELVKKLDPTRPVTVHAGDPSAVSGGWTEATAIDRGNDWNFADDLDGIGCSSFPKWHQIDDADFAVRVEFVKSAARQKLVWLSEVQGGRAALGFEVYQPVDAASQQRWIWNGLACGADTILFWCWRDEVFGCESAGFGLAGRDGLAEERLAAMKVTGDLLESNRSLFDAYRPDQATVGVFFSPPSY
jgi:beta-galactosidase